MQVIITYPPVVQSATPVMHHFSTQLIRS